jgi:biopolymer transport protein ExbB
VIPAALVLALSTAAEALGAGAAHSPDAVDVRLVRGADLTLRDLLRAGGPLGYALVALSMAVVAWAVYCWLEGRSASVFPRGLHAELMRRLGSRASPDRAAALAVLEGDRSLYARAARRAFELSPEAPQEAVRGVVDAAGARDASVMRGRVSHLLHFGAVAALLGLMGTAAGMLAAFAAAAREVFQPVLAHAAAAKAVVTTLLGAGVATVAVALYFVLRARLERALADAEYALAELVAASTARARGKGSSDTRETARGLPRSAPSLQEAKGWAASAAEEEEKGGAA